MVEVVKEEELVKKVREGLDRIEGILDELHDAIHDLAIYSERILEDVHKLRMLVR